MYAHQVIDSLNTPIGDRHLCYKKEFYSNQQHKNNCLETEKWAVNILEICHKFHLGTSALIDKATNFEPNAQSRDTILKFNKYIKTPYPLCWFDWITGEKEISKKGVLVLNNDAAIHIGAPEDFNGIVGIPFFFAKYYNEWTMYPHYGAVNLDTNGLVFPSVSKSSLNLDDIIKPIGNSLLTIVRGLTILNCKNIVSETVKVPKKLNKKRLRQNKLPLFNYKVLKIKLSNKGKKQNGNQGLDHNRIHFCRGHFKEYTKEKPLFGKITGLWWWQSHVRGQNTDGIVVKDYQLCANYN